MMHVCACIRTFMAHPRDKEESKDDCVGKQKSSSNDSVSYVLVYHVQGSYGHQRDAGHKGAVHRGSNVLGVVQGWDVDPPILKGKEKPHPQVDGLECK